MTGFDCNSNPAAMSEYALKPTYNGTTRDLFFVPERFRLTFRHRASCILGQAFHYSPENAFYIFNQQIYFII